MANTITLKRRIGSVKNTKQITKAMELVAASKMRRAQEYASTGRIYREAAYSLLTRLSMITEVNEHPLFIRRDIKTRLYVAITSNRGLAGAYNSNILRLMAKSIIEDNKAGIKSQVVAVGKQAAQFARRLRGRDHEGDEQARTRSRAGGFSDLSGPAGFFTPGKSLLVHSLFPPAPAFYRAVNHSSSVTPRPASTPAGPTSSWN